MLHTKSRKVIECLKSDDSVPSNRGRNSFFSLVIWVWVTQPGSLVGFAPRLFAARTRAI